MMHTSLPNLSMMSIGDDRPRDTPSDDDKTAGSIKRPRKFYDDRPGDNEEGKVVPALVVSSVEILPAPYGAKLPYNMYVSKLEDLHSLIVASVTADDMVKGIRARLVITPDPNYEEAIGFLASYLAVLVMIINQIGIARWGGPMANINNYPYHIAERVHNATKAIPETEKALRQCLERICPGLPTHPWLQSERGAARRALEQYIDIMGGVVDMLSKRTKGDNGARRDLLIATQGGAFVGHIFVTQATQAFHGHKAIWPYGISRSALYLPGACVPPTSGKGFVDELFGWINRAAEANSMTHAFTWPLKKMKDRLLTMNYHLIEKRKHIFRPEMYDLPPVYRSLSPLVSADADDDTCVVCLCVISIFGKHSVLTRHILEVEWRSWDFVMLEVTPSQG